MSDFLGKFKPGDLVFYSDIFHDDTGNRVDPTTPYAKLRTSAGVWSDLTVPAKQNTQTGHFGGSIDTTGFTEGQWTIEMGGVVATAKNVAKTFNFQVEAIDNADIHGHVSGLVNPDNASITAIKAQTDKIIFDGSNKVSATATVDNTAIANAVDSKLSTVHGSGQWGGILGAKACTYTLTESDLVTPIADVDIYVTTDLAGNNVIASGKTDAYGIMQPKPMLDDGTYYFWRSKSGYNFVNPDTEVVS